MRALAHRWIMEGFESPFWMCLVVRCVLVLRFMANAKGSGGPPGLRKAEDTGLGWLSFPCQVSPSRGVLGWREQRIGSPFLDPAMLLSSTPHPPLHSSQYSRPRHDDLARTSLVASLKTGDFHAVRNGSTQITNRFIRYLCR